MTNYELALELLDKGMADKHHTFIANRRRGR